MRFPLHLILSTALLLAPVQMWGETAPNQSDTISDSATKTETAHDVARARLLKLIQGEDGNTLLFHFDPDVTVDNEAEIEQKWRALSRDQILSHLVNEMTAQEKTELHAPALGLEKTQDPAEIEALYKGKVFSKALVIKAKGQANFSNALGKRILQSLTEFNEKDLQDFMIKKENVLSKARAKLDNFKLQLKSRQGKRFETIQLPAGLRSKILSTINSALFSASGKFLHATRNGLHVMVIACVGLDIGETLARAISKKISAENSEALFEKIKLFGGFYTSIGTGLGIYTQKLENGRSQKTLEIFAEVEWKKRAILPSILVDIGIGVGAHMEVADKSHTKKSNHITSYENWTLPFLMNFRENQNIFSLNKIISVFSIPWPNLINSQGKRLTFRIPLPSFEGRHAPVMCQQALAN